MTSQTRTKKKILRLAAVFALLACFFQFALVGYQTIVLVCLGLAVLTLLLGYAPARWMRRLLLGLTVAGVLVLGAVEVPIVAAAQGDFPNDADYLVVLGAGVNGRTPSLSLLNRLTAAETWLQANPDGKAILSGGRGNGEDISEAEAMYQWLTAHGIAAERLYKEEALRYYQRKFSIFGRAAAAAERRTAAGKGSGSQQRISSLSGKISGAAGWLGAVGRTG